MRAAMAVLALAGALGCATGYHPDGGISGGFSEMRLSDRAYEVTFRGNGYTSGAAAQRLALRRAADLTRQAGLTHFVVDSRDNDPTVGVVNQQIITAPNATVRFRMLTAQEATAAPPGVAYEAATILAQFGAEPALVSQPPAGQTIVRR